MSRVHRNGRVLYWDGGSVTWFRWGAHIRRSRVAGGANWRQYRIAVFSRKEDAPGFIKFIDYSVRDTKRATSKPVSPCWRFWVGAKVGIHVSKHTQRFYETEER